MLLWMLSIFAFLLAVSRLVSGGLGQVRDLLSQTEERFHRELEFALAELQGGLESGILPSPESWRSLGDYRAPWGPLCLHSIDELRKSGGAILPTLKRLRSLARAQLDLHRSARARASQSLAQAGVGALLVPVLGVLLHGLLPGISECGVLWWFVVGGAMLLAAAGGVWVLAMAERARWGGLPQNRRHWALESLVAGERFIAMLRAGSPPDIAWLKVCENVRMRAPGLAEMMGAQLWGKERVPDTGGESLVLFSQWAHATRMGIKASVIEGRPCQERVELAVEALRLSWTDQVERQLGLLGTRTLKPLFCCVAPALLGTLAVGFFLAWDAALTGGGL